MDKTQELVVTCDSNCLEKVRDFVRQRAKESGFSGADVGRMVLAADEASSNIIKHSYRFEPHHKLAVSWNERPDRAVVEICDDSPNAQLPSVSMTTDFDIPAKVKFRHANGYGKHLLRELVDDLVYEAIPGSHNRVSLIKFRNGHKKGRNGAFPGHYDRDRLRSYTLKSLFDLEGYLDQQRTAEDMLKLFFNGIMGCLTVHPVSLMTPVPVSQTRATGFQVIGHMGLSKKLLVEEMLLPKHGWVIETLWASRGPVLTQEFQKQLVPKEEMEVLEKLRAEVVIPVFILDQLRGVVALGAKKNRRPFSEEDMRMVTLLASHSLLLLNNLRKDSEPVGPSHGQIRKSLGWAIDEVKKVMGGENVRFVFEKGDKGADLPPVLMAEERLKQVFLKLLMNIHYLATDGLEIQMRLGRKDEKTAALEMAYWGSPLSLEAGGEGYNPILDRLMSDGIKLVDCKKLIEAGGGKIVIDLGKDAGKMEKEDERPVVIRLCLPFAK